MDERIIKLSKTIVNYSVAVKPKERVLITCTIECKPLVSCLIKDIVKVGGIPFVNIVDSEISALLLANTKDNRLDSLVEKKKYEVLNYDIFINIRYTDNEYNTKFTNNDIRKKIGKMTEELDDIRINERKWVLLNYPSMLDAFKAHTTTDTFYNYAMDVMTVDYEKMNELITPLKELMEHTSKVRLVAPNTDITFRIDNIPVIPCCGTMNIPDGEIYTAPIKDSVNGTITYNTACPYNGNIYTGVSLTFEAGKIIECHCNENNAELKEIFDTDAGARYIGEFSLGLNPLITTAMGDILYDEKIIGSIHFTPGRAYKDAFNGNTSAIHWDMVLVMLRSCGGGEIYFDDVLIRKDGLFVLPNLKKLNYNLK